MITEIAEQRYAAFRHGAFLRYLTARFLATFSTQIVSVAVGWQIYDLTRDPFDLGLVGIIQFLPALLLVLVTGAVADRFGRRLIMALSGFLEALCALAILLMTLRGLERRGPVFVVLAVFGIARAFFGPASSCAGGQSGAGGGFRQCGCLELVGLADRRRIVGPVAGGLLYGLAAEAAYATAALMMLTGGLLVLSIPKPATRLPNEKPTLDTLFARLQLYLEGKDRARCDLARPVRRAALRRFGAAAGLCARHIGTRTVGARPVARGARRRRDRRRHLARRPYDQG